MNVDDEFVIIGKITTSNEKTNLCKCLVVLCEHVKNNLMVNELEYELEKHCSRERTQQTADNYDNENRDIRMTTTIDDKLIRPVVRLAPLLYESVFWERRKVGASELRDQELKFERD